MTRTDPRSLDLEFRPGSYWDLPHDPDPGGAGLPAYEAGEVEIARIAWPRSSMNDVVSVRARPARGRIHYRAVDDIGSGDLPLSPRSSVEPLTFEELTSLIDSIVLDEDTGRGVMHGCWDWYYRENGDRPEACTEQVALSSDVYPELAAWYEREARAWRKARYTQEAEAEAEAQATNPPRDDTAGVAPHLRAFAFHVAERVRARGYDDTPLFTVEGAKAYVEHGHFERAAAAFAACCGQPTPPARYAHLGPLDLEAFDRERTPTRYTLEAGPAEREEFLRELPGVVHAIAEASLGGGGLPPLLPEEVEIARVRLAGNPPGLLSLRARADGAVLRYRLVDGVGSRIGLPFTESRTPLALPAVVRLLDEAFDAGPDGTDTPETSRCDVGAVHSNWQQEIANGAEPAEAQAAVVVSSAFYPALARWYAVEARRWFD